MTGTPDEISSKSYHLWWSLAGGFMRLMSGMADNEEFITPKRNGNALQFATPKNAYVLCYYEIHD